MNLVLTNAGHTYGFDNMGTPAPAIDFGTMVTSGFSTDLSQLKAGQSFTYSATYSKGYVGTTQLTWSGDVNFTLTSLTYTRADTGQTLFTLSGAAPVDILQISLLDDFGLALLTGNDGLRGNDFNNVLEGFGGNDTIDGGAGTDTAVFRGLRSQYTISHSAGNPNIAVSGPDGTDALLNVERLHFNDTTLAFDASGNAGQAYRLYQAAFNRTPDTTGLTYWTHSLDNGNSLHNVALSFVTGPEFAAKYGSLNNSAFVTQLYQNVLHRAPDAGGLAFHTGNLDAGISRADVLSTFSESQENQAALVGVFTNGVVLSS